MGFWSDLMGNNQGKPVSGTDEVNLNHFRLLRVVGKGAFGKVRIVERKDSGLTFALKYIRKDEIVRSESVRNIIRERRMMEHLNHPFLCNLRYSFQDVEYLYLVIDLMTGGDLRFHILRKTFTEDCVRFWMAELACALRYIHSQGIVHRDVKPDNILLDAEGHVHLADFNVASDFRPSKQLTSKSGTLAYLAPEVFNGTGYLSECDWWSMGVCFYECIYGKRPFEGKTQSALADSVCAAAPAFFVTKPPVSMPCLHAMSSFLETDKRKRIGAVSWQSLTQNPFFQSVDFVALERKEIAPIFVPSSEKTNFDATYDLEELLLEEAPLEARSRKQKPRAELRNDATDREIREDELYRMIETLFEPFDYTHARYDINAGAAIAGNLPEEHVELVTVEPSQVPARSMPTSPEASPPLRADMSPSRTQGDENFPALDQLRTNLPRQSSAVRPPSASKSFSRPIPPQRPQPISRNVSQGGGARMVLDAQSSWSGLADHTTPAQSTEPAGTPLRAEKAGGSSMLGFLSRKRGRDRSPKPKEVGVLGKVGARHIVSG